MTRFGLAFVHLLLGTSLGLVVQNPPEKHLSGSSDGAQSSGRSFELKAPLVRQKGSTHPDPEMFSQCITKLRDLYNRRTETANHWRQFNGISKCEAYRLELNSSYVPESHFAPANDPNFKFHSPEEAVKKLRGRHLWFVGDSVTFQQVISLGCMLQQARGNVDVGSWKTRSLKWGKGMHFRWEQEALNVTLEWFGGGRQYESVHSKTHGVDYYNFAEIIPRIANVMRAQDILQVNSGLHDNNLKELTDRVMKGFTTDYTLEPPGTILEPQDYFAPFDSDLKGPPQPQPAGRRKGRKDLDRVAMQSEAELETAQMTRVAYSLIRAVKALRDYNTRSEEWQKKRGRGFPTFLWRESTPQHFNTLDGTFSANSRRLNQSVVEAAGQCRAMNKANQTVLETANRRNDMANPILEEANIPIVKIWEALSDLDDEHCEANDCTHWSFDANGVIVQAFLNSIEDPS